MGNKSRKEKKAKTEIKRRGNNNKEVGKNVYYNLSATKALSLTIRRQCCMAKKTITNTATLLHINTHIHACLYICMFVYVCVYLRLCKVYYENMSYTVV